MARVVPEGLDQFEEAFQFPGIPAMMILDKKGQIQSVHIGTDEEMESESLC